MLTSFSHGAIVLRYAFEGSRLIYQKPTLAKSSCSLALANDHGHFWECATVLATRIPSVCVIFIQISDRAMARASVGSSPLPPPSRHIRLGCQSVSLARRRSAPEDGGRWRAMTPGRWRRWWRRAAHAARQPADRAPCTMTEPGACSGLGFSWPHP